MNKQHKRPSEVLMLWLEALKFGGVAAISEIIDSAID
jgi:hypothetical protein